MKTKNGFRLHNNKDTSELKKKELKLIARICQKDENALKELYFIYYSRIYKFISRMNGGYFIDEIINDVMFVVWKKAATYNQTCLLSTWIFGIAYNKIRQSISKIHNEKEVSLDTLEVESAQFGALDTGLKQIEMSNLLDEALRSLSLEQRAVIELTYVHGLNYREISTLMDTPENTVKTRMFHARIKLLKVLKSMGESYENQTE